MKIPICHVQVLPIKSGVQRVMLEIFRHLDRSRYAPHVVCQDQGPLAEELAELEIPCHFLRTLVRPIQPHNDYAAYRGLYRLFREHRFQVVHTHSSKPGVLGRIAARRAGVPLVVHHVHSFAFHEFSPRRTQWFYKRLEAFSGVFCDRVIFVNVEERDMAIRERILPAAKCVTIHNGVDLSMLDRARECDWRARWRRDQKLDDETVAILVIGRLDAQKQPLILPEIAAALERRHCRRPWRIVIAGDGEFQPQVAHRVRALEMDRRVTMLGWQGEPQLALHGSDIVLQPSLWEGLSMSLLEAQAARLPIVASDVKGNREVVTPSTGRLCSPRDAAEYASHLAALVDDAPLRARLGRAARVQAELRFDAAVNMPQIGRMYDELLGLEPLAPWRRRAA